MTTEALEQQVKQLKGAILGLLGWTYGGACSDCEMFREAPACIEFQHHFECAHLQSINEALVVLGRPLEEGHHFEDPKGEMRYLRALRIELCGRYRVECDVVLPMRHGKEEVVRYYLSHEDGKDDFTFAPDKKKACVFVGERAAKSFCETYQGVAPSPATVVKLPVRKVYRKKTSK